MKVKIGIVEDDILQAKSVSKMLISLGYEVTHPAEDYGEAIHMIDTLKPDVLLVDIHLKGKLDGIDLAKVVHDFYFLPVIFHTASLLPETIERAKLCNPSAYLTKPVSKDQLFTAIELAVDTHNNHLRHKPEAEKRHRLGKAALDHIFVYDGHTFRKVCFSELLYVKSEANYVGLHFKDGTSILVRSTLFKFAAQLEANNFIRVHRCYIANTQNIDNVTNMEIMIKGDKIPLSKIYREKLYSSLGIDYQRG